MPSFISIPHWPNIEIAYRVDQIGSPPAEHLHADTPKVWVVFLGGLMVAMSSWDTVIELIKAEYTPTEQSQQNGTITLLRYDRYGLAETRDRNTWHETRIHDLTDSVVEFHQLINAIIHKQPNNNPNSPPPKLILVGHSIGVVLARLYMHAHPRTISALLSVDTNMTNTDFVSLYPNPDGRTFNAAGDLPDDTPTSELRALRTVTETLFGPTQSNDECLGRSNVQTLLPSPSTPKLIAPGGEGPYITVISNDPRTLAEQMFGLFQVSRSLVMKYLVTAWKGYNGGLLKLTDPGRARGIVYAEGAGHFVQTERPDVVAKEVLYLVKSVLEPRL